MKKVIVGLVVAAIASVASAELINWAPSALLTVEGTVVEAGWVIQMFQDVNSDNTGTWYDELVLDNSGLSTTDDILFGASTLSMDAGGGNVVISTLANVSVDAGNNLYSVIFNSADMATATAYAVFESTPYVVSAGSGVSLPNGTMGVGAAAGSWQAIPEPATVGLMGVAGLGLFLARKKARRED